MSTNNQVVVNDVVGCSIPVVNSVSPATPPPRKPRKKRSTASNSGSSGGLFITVKEAAALLCVAPTTLYHYVSRAPFEADPIPFVKLSARCLRFHRVDLIAWARRRGGGTIQKPNSGIPETPEVSNGR